MKYLYGTFTLPAANPHTPGINWDLAMLSIEEFKEKYGVTPSEYIDGKRSE